LRRLSINFKKTPAVETLIERALRAEVDPARSKKLL
jgi:hypothetical protein